MQEEVVDALARLAGWSPGPDAWKTNAPIEFGRIGTTAANGPGWTDIANRSCDQLAAIYCFEQQ